MSSAAISSFPRGPRVALVTGAANRIGAAVAKRLHAEGYSIAIHYKTSRASASSLCEELNILRSGSAAVFCADLGAWRGEEAKLASMDNENSNAHTANTTAMHSHALPSICSHLIQSVVDTFGDLHVLVNNASAFTKTPLILMSDAAVDKALAMQRQQQKHGVAKEVDANSQPPTAQVAGDMFESAQAFDAEEALVVSNALAPFYLTRSFARYVQIANEEQKRNRQSHCDSAAAPTSASSSPLTVPIADRSIILFGDALVSRCPHKTYGLYSLAKIGAENLTQTASTELASIGVRVNCIRPGFNIFPNAMPEDEKQRLRSLVPLHGGQEGTPLDVAEAIAFLVDPSRARYLTGSMLDVDGGLRHVAMS